MQLTKTLRVMQWTAVFLLGCCLQVAAAARTQEVTVSAKSLPLEKVLQIVEQQTGVVFLYDAKTVNVNDTISVNVNKIPLADFLANLFKGRPVTYRMEGNTVILKTKFKSPKPFLFETAPPITVRGKIVNEKGEPVIASVLVKGTNRGVITDNSGLFSIDNVDDRSTLVISGVGIETQEIKVNNRNEITITVPTKMVAEQEVVINAGYYTITKRNNTGNIGVVKSADIEKQPVTNPLMALQGRVAGVDVTPYSGVAGVAPSVQIRGQNSLRLDGGYPLFIVDGIPVDAKPINSASFLVGDRGFDPLSFINPENIESIEILKDAAATSIYGSRGANGVVRITTKKTKRTDRMGFEAGAYTGIGQLTREIDLLNTPQYLAMRKEAFANDNTPPGPFGNWDIDGTWDTTRYTNWQKELLGGTAMINDFNARVTGGNYNTSFAIGMGYHKETVIYPGDFGFKRFTANIALDHKSTDGKLQIALNTNFGSNKSKLFNDNNFAYSALALSPDAPALRHPDGSINWAIASLFGGTFDYATWTNPLAYLLKTHDANGNTLVANSTVAYKLLKNITIKTSFGYTQLVQNEILKDPIAAASPLFTWNTGTGRFSNNQRQSWIIEPQIEYNKSLGNHKLNAIIGSTFQGSTSSYESIVGTGYTSDALLGSAMAAPARNYTADDKIDYRYTAAYTRLGYSYKEKYLLDFTGRRDGSSRFGPGNKYGNFGAFGAAWIVSGEEFLKNDPVISYLKLRGSYGTTGNDQIGDYGYLNLYQLPGLSYAGVQGLVPSALGNSAYRWEITKKLEAALETSLFNDRIFIDAAWYRNRSSNQLIQYTLPATTGFLSILSNFDALVQNSGWEFAVSTRNFKNNRFVWTTSVNLTLPSNKLVKFDGLEDSPYATFYQIGQSLNIFNIYKWEGVNPETGKHEFLDKDGDGALTDKDKSFSPALGRLYYGGINNTFQFKGIELSFLFQFSKARHYKYLPLIMPGTFAGAFGNQPAWVMDRWQGKGDITDIALFSQDYINSQSYSNLTLSDHNLANITFLRLKTLSLSYRFPSPLVNKWAMQGLSVFIQGQNLLTFSNFKKVWDPETLNGMPPLRIISIGLNAKF